jgi:hypothetical protein
MGPASVESILDVNVRLAGPSLDVVVKPDSKRATATTETPTWPTFPFPARSSTGPTRPGGADDVVGRRRRARAPADRERDALVLRDAPDIERRVRELVALESECCAFLEFEIARDGDGLALEVHGAPAVRPIIEQFFGRTLA